MCFNSISQQNVKDAPVHRFHFTFSSPKREMYVHAEVEVAKVLCLDETNILLFGNNSL